ncbi:MAG: hypothetical protein RL291_1103, partial [Pseudomonadota bacterium]
MSLAKLIAAIGAGTAAGAGSISMARAQSQYTLPPGRSYGPIAEGDKPAPRRQSQPAQETRTVTTQRTTTQTPAPMPSPPPLPPVSQSDRDRRRAELLAEANRLKGVVDFETKGRGGYGPKAQAAQEDLRKAEKALTDFDREPSTFMKYALPVAAIAVGIVGGRMLARSIVGSAQASGAATIKSVEALAAASAKLVRGQPKGVLAGTVPGDVARANVQAAQAALARQPGTVGASGYIAPALLAAEVAASAGVRYTSDDPTITLAATGTMMAGIGALAMTSKGVLAARAMRASPKAMAQLQSVTNRLARESSGKIAAVTQAKVATRVVQAEATTRMARTQAQGAVKVIEAKAGASASAARARGQARVAAARLKADTTKAVDTQKAKAAVAKAQGSARRARANAALPKPVASPQSPTPPKAPAQAPRSVQRRAYVPRQRAPYKDTWVDS